MAMPHRTILTILTILAAALLAATLAQPTMSKRKPASAISRTPSSPPPSPPPPSPQPSSTPLPAATNTNTDKLGPGKTAIRSPSPFSGLKRAVKLTVIIYVCAAVILIVSSRAQTFLIYLHWINPPTRLFPLTDLQAHRLSNTGRNIRVHNLCGWHILPPGAPFAPPANSTTSHAQRNRFFNARLLAPHQRVMLFFHGNCGTRAFPSKRVNLVKLLNAQLNAHLITFDYSGFADSAGHPSEHTFYADARLMVDWVSKRMHRSSSLFLYGQSLGSFAATHVGSVLSSGRAVPAANATAVEDARLMEEEVELSAPHPTGLILDAPPASLQSAAKTHPIVKPFRLAGLQRIFEKVIHESHDSTRLIGRIDFPILIMHGREDGMIPAWQGKLLADTATKMGNPHVRFVEFEDVGHVDVSGAHGYLRTVDEFLGMAESEAARGLSLDEHQ